MSSLSRRARLGAAALLALGAPLVAAAPADAHTCARVEVWVDGSVRAVGSCHQPPGDPDDLCAAAGLTPNGTGATFVACVYTAP